MKRRIRLLTFSTAPFCQGALGSQNQLRAPIPSSKALNPANSVPRSKVKLWRAKAGKGENVSMILSMIGRECRLVVLDHHRVTAFALDE